MKTIEDAYAVLKETIDILNDMKINWVLDGGTLLGFIRNRTFCKDDYDDIDITIWDREHNSNAFVGIIPNLMEKFINGGYILYHKWDGDGKTTSHQLAFEKEGIKVDLFFKERKGRWSWHCLWEGDRPKVWKKNSAEYFDNTTDFYVGEGLVVSVPIDWEDYLYELYDDWRTPKHRSEWSCYSHGTAFTTLEWVKE